MRVVALIPAHNEREAIADAIVALQRQTRRPDRIIVVADNCTDDTASIATVCGAEVLRTIGNEAKKAGALNQAMAEVMPFLAGDDCILVADADSILAPDFIENAARRIPENAGVGGNFRGSPGAGLLGAFQRNEYARYARDVARRKGKCLVLTGTATLFSVAALRAVAAERGNHSVYDEHVLTEDNELTLRLMHLGYKVISPKDCTLHTEVMPTWRALAQQRLRWKRGAIQNLMQFGWTPITRMYWGRQLLSFIGVIVTLLYLLSVILGLLFMGVHVYPIWLAVTGIFCVERIVTVRERGWVWMLVGGFIFIEFVYDVFLQGVQARAYADAFLGRTGRW